MKIELPVDAHLPHDYAPGERLRLEAYRAIASADSEEDVAAVREELADRYGKLPEPVENLLLVAGLRMLARAAASPTSPCRAATSASARWSCGSTRSCGSSGSTRAASSSRPPGTFSYRARPRHHRRRTRWSVVNCCCGRWSSSRPFWARSLFGLVAPAFHVVGWPRRACSRLSAGGVYGVGARVCGGCRWRGRRGGCSDCFALRPNTHPSASAPSRTLLGPHPGGGEESKRPVARPHRGAARATGL